MPCLQLYAIERTTKMTQKNKTTNHKSIFSMLRYLVSCRYCWLFGHSSHHDACYTITTPCLRCGIWDIGYHDLVSSSRYELVKSWARYWFYSKWKYLLQKLKKVSNCVNDEEIPF